MLALHTYVCSVLQHVVDVTSYYLAGWPFLAFKNREEGRAHALADRERAKAYFKWNVYVPYVCRRACINARRRAAFHLLCWMCLQMTHPKASQPASLWTVILMHSHNYETLAHSLLCTYVFVRIFSPLTFFTHGVRIDAPQAQLSSFHFFTLSNPLSRCGKSCSVARTYVCKWSKRQTERYKKYSCVCVCVCVCVYTRNMKLHTVTLLLSNNIATLVFFSKHFCPPRKPNCTCGLGISPLEEMFFLLLRLSNLFMDGIK